MGKLRDATKKLRSKLTRSLPKNHDEVTVKSGDEVAANSTSPTKNEAGNIEEVGQTSGAAYEGYNGLFPVVRAQEVHNLQKSNTLVILVHGIGGHWKESWGYEDFAWVDGFLQPDLQKAGLTADVWSYGYDSRTNTNSVANVEDAARELLHRVYNHEASGPVIFVAHSLGGLVVKKAINLAHTIDKRYRALLQNVKGCVFLGVPHRGVDNTWWKTVPGKLIEISTIGTKGNNEFAKSIERASEVWKDIAHDFKHRAGELQIHSFYERRKVGPVVIVDRESAEMGLANEEVHPSDSDHVTINRFSQREQQRYQPIGDAIKELVREANSEFHEDEKSIEVLKDGILDTLTFPESRSRERGISKAYEETYSWALGDHTYTSKISSAELPPFLSWLKSNQTIVWVSGKPGCGKSTLMKHVYYNEKMKEALSQWADGKKLVQAGYFFFERGNDLQKSREGMLRSILHQVLSTRRDLIPFVYKDLFDRPSRPSPSLNTWSELHRALVSTLNSLHDSKICIFVDGLDEYRIIDRIREYRKEDFDLLFGPPGSDARWGLSRWIKDGHKEVAELFLKHGNRNNIKICLSSRELQVFEDQFGDFPRLRVHEHTAADISRYCVGKLTEQAPDLEDLPEFAELITEKSRGVFLWVRIVVEMLVDGNSDGDSKEELLRTLTSLPSEIGDLYLRIMENIQQGYLSESKKIFQLALTWTELSGRKSSDRGTLDIITLFLAEDGYVETGNHRSLVARHDKFRPQSWGDLKPRRTRLQRRLKSRCGGLLEGTYDVQFMHQTAKEFISRREIWGRIFLGSPGFRTEAEVTMALISGFVRRLKCCQEAFPPSPNHPAVELQSLWDTGMIPYDGFNIINNAIKISQQFESEPSDELLGPYVELLDELDKTGEQLIYEWKNSFPNSFRRHQTLNRNWTEALYEHEYDYGAQSRSFLSLMIQSLHRCGKYPKSKIQGKNIPKSQLQILLLHASGMKTLSRERGGTTLVLLGLNPNAIQILLQEGADPNYEHEFSRVIKFGETEKSSLRRTAWTYLLGSARHTAHSRVMTRRFIQASRHFLANGADPFACWRQNNKSGIRVVTPEIILSEILNVCEEGCKDDLTELLEELRKVAADRSTRSSIPPRLENAV